MVRRPESKSFLVKAGFEKRDPAKRLGFFVDRKIEAQAFKFRLDTYTLKSENLSLTFPFSLAWIPASAGMTRQPT
jgi:hypothetical protein